MLDSHGLGHILLLFQLMKVTIPSMLPMYCVLISESIFIMTTLSDVPKY